MWISFVRWMNDKMIEDLTPALLEKRPNTYTFTKSLAESILFHKGKDLPIAVFRPSIVGASLKDPMPVKYGTILNVSDVHLIQNFFVNSKLPLFQFISCPGL